LENMKGKELGRPRCRWEDNIRMDVRETEWNGADWKHLAGDRNHWKALMSTVMNFWLQKKVVSFLTS